MFGNANPDAGMNDCDASTGPYGTGGSDITLSMLSILSPYTAHSPRMPCVCEGLTMGAAWGYNNATCSPEPCEKKAGLGSLKGPRPGPPPALPGLSQIPRSPLHTSHIKRKQVTQMRQMVLVCDDSCNTPPPSPTIPTPSSSAFYSETPPFSSSSFLPLHLSPAHPSPLPLHGVWSEPVGGSRQIPSEASLVDPAFT